jgi:hypothetical protein
MNPNQVPINYTFTLDHVNLILAALGKLPFEQVSEIVNDIRLVALNALQAAEDAAKAEGQAPEVVSE